MGSRSISDVNCLMLILVQAIVVFNTTSFNIDKGAEHEHLDNWLLCLKT
jgi:hypothetical protein